MSKERIEQMQSQNAGWKLSYATERVDEKVMGALMDLAKETRALESMIAMQEGKIVNQIEGYESEKRSVLHTSARDFFKEPISSKEADFARREAYAEVEKLERYVQDRESEEITDLIQIGIGGSSLGPKAIYQALSVYQKRPMRVHFLSNIDPDSASKVLREVNLHKSLVIAVSKSGTTLETCVNEERIREAFVKEGMNPVDHFLAITGKNSPMDNSSRYHAIFYIWDFIGGRYSTTSMVGGVLLSLALGFDVYWELLEGAQVMDLVARSSSDEENLPLLGALLGIWNRNFLHAPALAVTPYSESLCYLPAHLQQLDMESNGKQIDKKGRLLDFSAGEILFGDVGTDCQHSFFQLLHQGSEVVPLEFIGSVKSQYGEDLVLDGTTSQEKLLSNLFAQMIALAVGQKSENPNRLFLGNRPSHLLLTEMLDPYRVGALLAYFEHKVAFQGFIWDINSFDQEGVQLGKKLSGQMMEAFRSGRAPVSGASFSLAEGYLDLMEDLL
jgi:glucose-6-phosphate isomerase